MAPYFSEDRDEPYTHLYACILSKSPIKLERKQTPSTRNIPRKEWRDKFELTNTLNSGNSDRKSKGYKGWAEPKFSISSLLYLWEYLPISLISPGCCIHCSTPTGVYSRKGAPVVLTLLLLLCNIYVDSHVIEMEIMLVFYLGICLQDYWSATLSKDIKNLVGSLVDLIWDF